MQIATEASVNTFIFSEQDLPGFADRPSAETRPLNAIEPSASQRLQSQDRPINNTRSHERPRKWQPYFRKVIPSMQSSWVMWKLDLRLMHLIEKTAICARVDTEIICQPVENRAYRSIMHERSKLAEKPKKDLRMLASTATSLGNAIYLPSNLAAGDFSNFIVSIFTLNAIKFVAEL